MQCWVQMEQIAAMTDECGEVFGLREVEAARQAGQDHAETENIGQRIVMADLVLPTHIARQIHRLANLIATLADLEIDEATSPPG